MRAIILSIIIGVVGCAALTTNVNHSSSKIILYVFNDETDRPGQTLEEEFWGTPGGLDTVEIKGKRLVDLYKQKFNTLKDTMLYTPEELDDFYHSFAFVFANDKGNVDTLYADRIFRFFKWKNKRKYYEDTTEFFRKHFGSFLIN
ncbi:MAG TPA: hypothetical protein VIY47_15245 [Ignavibacteriaceae bacterium]